MDSSHRKKVNGVEPKQILQRKNSRVLKMEAFQGISVQERKDIY